MAVLQKLGVRVTIVGQSPVFATAPPTPDYPNRQAGKMSGAAVPRFDPATRMAVRETAIGVNYVDPLDRLRRGGMCRYGWNSTCYYADDDHLSAAGSRRAARAFMIAALR